METPSTLLFGKRIQSYRKKRGWNQTQAAKVMGVQRTSLNRWENGKEMPNGESMTKLSDHLGIPVGSDEKALESLSRETIQMLLPFEKPVNIEFRIGPRRADAVQIQVQIKDLAG
jgi:transcriptional regulator with XRE-family HTH domain